MRFYNKTAKERLYIGAIYREDGCISFRPSYRADGYAKFYTGSHQVGAHLASWELENGPIPDGYVVDHLCHDPKICVGGASCFHRECINPEHLKAVTRSQNSSGNRNSRSWHLKEVCVNKHELTEENLYIYPNGNRQCRECRRQYRRERAKLPETKEKNNAWRRGNPKYLARKRELRQLKKLVADA